MTAVRFKIAYGQYSKGAVIEPPALFADWLIGAGIAERFGAATDSHQTETETAMLEAATTRRRGRPRKINLSGIEER